MLVHTGERPFKVSKKLKKIKKVFYCEFLLKFSFVRVNEIT